MDARTVALVADVTRLTREVQDALADYHNAQADNERLRDAIERAGKCLAMSNNGAREALAILRAAKEDASG